MGFRTLMTGAAVCLAFSAAAVAAPITGTPVGGVDTWITGPASTNLANYDLAQNNTPRPYVLFDSAAEGSVTLDFFNFAAGLAFFEIRIDGTATGATPHPIVTGDTIHTGGVGVVSGSTALDRNFLATQYVDVRLALGGEADYRFDWTRFEAVPRNDVPLPGTLALLGLGVVGFGMVVRRKR